MKIDYLLDYKHSRRDMYGNCYWTCQVTDTNTGAAVEYTVDYRDAFIHVPAALAGETSWVNNYRRTEVEMPVMKFKAYVKHARREGKPLEHLGGDSDHMASVIKLDLEKVANEEG